MRQSRRYRVTKRVVDVVLGTLLLILTLPILLACWAFWHFTH